MNRTKILILDDDEKLRFNLSLFLEDEGYECSSAGNSKEAMSLIERNKFDVAIVDIRLPGLSGDEFIPIAANIDEDLQYIINTGSTDYELDFRLQELGLNEMNILRKPVEDMYIYVSKIRELVNDQISF
jgi:DNA-binding NtrC family response regulator